MEILHKTIELLLPFQWTQYAFMKNAFLAVLLIAPAFALLGTMVVNNRMVFFSDVLGHSAFTGIAIGVLLGCNDFLMPMLLFAVILAILINLLRVATNAAQDTVLGVFFAIVVALGIVILSRQGGFAKFTQYLIGDILIVSPWQIAMFAAVSLLVLIYWLAVYNRMVLISVNPALAKSRGVAVFLTEVSFTVLLAVVVTISIRLVGILIINSLLILPAAAARNLSFNTRQYSFWAIGISLVSGLAGLISSYYWGTATGATIVLYAGLCYIISAVYSGCRSRS